MIFNDEVVTYCVFTCYLSHYYTIAWDRLSNQFFCLCMCVCMYVCMYVCMCLCADGRHLGFRFWAIILASINIFAPNLHGNGKSAARWVPVLKNQIFENPRWRTAVILDFDFGPQFRRRLTFLHVFFVRSTAASTT